MIFFYWMTLTRGCALGGPKSHTIKNILIVLLGMPTYLDNYNLVGATHVDCMQDVSLGPDYLSLLK